jgi:hypothetical protein
MYAKNKVFHYKITRGGSGYHLAVKGMYDQQHFTTLVDLVEFGGSAGTGLPAALLLLPAAAD